MGCWGCVDTREVGYWGCGMFEIWDVWDLECSACAMFGMWDVGHVVCSGCGMFGCGMLGM